MRVVVIFEVKKVEMLCKQLNTTFSKYVKSQSTGTINIYKNTFFYKCGHLKIPTLQHPSSGFEHRPVPCLVQNAYGITSTTYLAIPAKNPAEDFTPNAYSGSGAASSVISSPGVAPSASLQETPVPTGPQTPAAPLPLKPAPVCRIGSKKPPASGGPGPSGGPSAGERLVRQEPGPVRLGFIPDEWFMFFYKKTGVTGMGTFCFTLMTTLMSKEYYVLEHEYYGGLSMAILCALAVKYIGTGIAKYIDSEVDEYEANWTKGREKQKTDLDKAVNTEEKQQWQMEGQLMLVKAKRENVHLQLEAEYRKRLMIAYDETKRRLEYCVTREYAERGFAKRMMGVWVVKEVKANISEDLEKLVLSKCMEDLKVLADTFKGLTEPYKPVAPVGSDESTTEDPKKTKPDKK